MTCRVTFRLYDVLVKGVLEDARAAKVNDLEHAHTIEDEVIELEVAMGDTHAVQVIEALKELPPAASDFLAGHHTAHDHVKQIVGAVFHDFVKMAVFLDQVQGLNHVRVMKCRTNAEFVGHLLDIVLFGFVRKPFPELLDGKCLLVTRSLDESNRSPGSFANVPAYILLFMRMIKIGPYWQICLKMTRGFFFLLTPFAVSPLDVLAELVSKGIIAVVVVGFSGRKESTQIVPAQERIFSLQRRPVKMCPMVFLVVFWLSEYELGSQLGGRVGSGWGGITSRS